MLVFFFKMVFPNYGVVLENNHAQQVRAFEARRKVSFIVHLTVANTDVIIIIFQDNGGGEEGYLDF